MSRLIGGRSLLARRAGHSPNRGFPKSEYVRRLNNVQNKMDDLSIDAIFLTSPEEIRYFSGFYTPLFLSPTRPWYLILPSKGSSLNKESGPIAIFPDLFDKDSFFDDSVSSTNQPWLPDVRTWRTPGIQDDGGVSLITDALRSIKKHGNVGIWSGRDNSLRMCQSDFLSLNQSLNGHSINFVDCSKTLKDLMVPKSSLEIEKMGETCSIVSDAFQLLPSTLLSEFEEHDFLTSREICRLMSSLAIQGGVDEVPYVAGCTGSSGYNCIITPPSDHQIQHGDVLAIDVGAKFDGYYCDFDRNFGFLRASQKDDSVLDKAKQVYSVLHSSLEAGINACIAGNTTADVWKAMDSVLSTFSSGTDQGHSRMGHGVGLYLTEWPSITRENPVELTPGMVLAIEPALNYNHNGIPKSMVHEENVVVREDKTDVLTKRAPEQLPIIYLK